MSEAAWRFLQVSPELDSVDEHDSECILLLCFLPGFLHSHHYKPYSSQKRYCNTDLYNS